MLGKQKQITIDYRQKFGDEQGERVLRDLEKRCLLFRGGINTAKAIDVNTLLVMEGEANVIKYIYKMLSRDPLEDRPDKAINITSAGE